MKVYIWILELAAAGGLFLLGRWIWHKMAERKTHAAHVVRKQGSAASRAERDRLDIEALTKGIAEPAWKPGTDRPSTSRQTSASMSCAILGAHSSRSRRARRSAHSTRSTVDRRRSPKVTGAASTSSRPDNLAISRAGRSRVTVITKRA